MLTYALQIVACTDLYKAYNVSYTPLGWVILVPTSVRTKSLFIYMSLFFDIYYKRWV